MNNTNPEHAVPTPDNSPTPTPGLIDVEFNPANVWRMIPFAMLVAVIVVLAIAGFFLLLGRSNISSLFAPIPAIVFGVASGMVAIPLVRRSMRRRERLVQQRIESRLQENPNESVAESIKVVVNDTLRYNFFGRGVSSSGRRFRRPSMMGVVWHLNGLTRGLMKGDRHDLTLRFCTPEFAVPVQPIDVPIEPLPLDETMPFVSQLGDADQNDFDIDHDGDKTDTPDANRDESPDESSFRRKLKRRIKLLGGRWMFVLFWFVWASHAIEALVTWRITFSLVFYTGIVALFSSGLGGRGAWRSRQQWLIVPGGLISRKSNRRGKWDVHLFDRRTSVLCVYRQSRNHWFVCVADDDTDQIATVTPTESLALLRAWLSPLPPPSREQLGDLAG